jgi:predicted dehydrogenase
MSPSAGASSGAGGIATTRSAPAVHAARGAVLQAAAARDLARAEALGPVTRTTSYAALLADDEVDAVYISLSNEAHLPWTVAALRAGKAVLCEKPLGLTAAEVDEMAAVAASTGSCGGGQLVPLAPAVRLAQSRWPRSAGPARQRRLHLRRQLEGNYRLDPTRGGGALYDVGCYAVSACLWAVGRGVPDDVVARSELGPTGVDLDSQAILSWPGAEAEVRAGMTGGDGQWLVITGERGEIELRDAPYTSWKDDATQLWVSDGRDTERVDVPATDAYRVMVEEVSSVLRGGPGWVLPLAESRETAAVLDAARASAAAGGTPVAPD